MGVPIKGRADYWEPGTWNVACSECGRKRKANQMERNWQGLYRCPEHNEPRQPQDFARGIRDIMTVPFAQPERDLMLQFCSFNDRSAIAGYGTAGCMIAGNTKFIPTIQPGTG
jgi:hypothetical protein